MAKIFELDPKTHGKPSLAEWVAAAEGSALGMPVVWDGQSAVYQVTDGKLGRFVRVDLLVLGGVRIAHVSAWTSELAQRCDTPAELRACLDRLAGGVS